MQNPTKIVVQTKKIGGHKLNKIISLVYERCDYDLDIGMEPVGWWVYIEGRENTICNPVGYGETKTEAKNEFKAEFEKNLDSVKDLLKTRTIVVVQTKRIGKYKLKRIASVLYERYNELDCSGWMVSINEGKGFAFGWGVTKTEAKNEFVKEFELSARTFCDLIDNYQE